ncbi:MAG: DUF2382 domain-containing protein [Symplocastrum torsivum CPER-KK1]|jgi:uncharacterized protein (TIGR02271 family)|uniref:DUF2382 domain-containing protein n=1 Tax=Symplocastrum torsivum CPER-KK1 TaxID=450513 RepID=A0A951UDI2_9CYAN|nr:DUF2382 domain-containing protein [Symplocastrum torsivum CPER-KK1]
MALFKIADFNPNYQQDAFEGEDIKGLDVYAGRTAEKIGTIEDVLVDETGRFRYLVIDTGFWIFGKKVLLPVGRCHVDAEAHRIYAIGIAHKEQAEKLPEYHESMTVDYDYEERVRKVYRTPVAQSSVPVTVERPVEASRVVGMTSQPATPRPASNQVHAAAYDHNTYTYDHEPSMYQMNEQEHQRLRLYEERLVANKHRRKAGEVAIGKRVETEQARVSIPVEKERIVIERTTPQDVGSAVIPGNVDFREGEVAHMSVYEETADVRKQAFVREEVNIRKEVEHDTVDATEVLRREELDVNTQGHPIVDRSNQHPYNR